ncbi:MAG: 4-hydroxybenzoate polyprenyltransferase [Planctomycetota bacterium]|jgi:4-hydroxybenzoate polyprenyltransferase
MKALALGRLLRISLAPSAVADILVGLAIGGGGHFPSGFTCLAAVSASLLIYHGGLALNDWADREHDGRTRPERPVPSGAIPAGVAFALGFGMMLLGVVLGSVAEARAWPVILGVALLAMAYDFFGRGPLRGPLLLGLCRAGNLGFGITVGMFANQSALDPWRLAPALLYGLYVFSVSRLGRLEDGEDEGPVRERSRPPLLIASLLLLGAPLIYLVPGLTSAPGGLAAATLLCLLASKGLLAKLGTIEHREQVGPLMGMALRRLMVLTAALGLAAGGPGAGGWLAAGLALLGFPISHLLRRAFPPS